MARPPAIFRRFGFRSLILSLGAVYFLVMYIFHSDLQLSGGPPRDGWARLEIGADATGSLRRKGSRAASRDEDIQLVFERMRQNERAMFANVKDDQAEKKQERIVDVREALRPKPEADVDRMKLPAMKERGTAVSTLDDLNIPTGCQDSDENEEFSFRSITSEVYVYSAYWDSRPNDFDNRLNGSYIRIIAIIRSSARPALICSFERATNQTDDSPATSRITYYEMCENHGRLYGGFILSCLVPQTISVPMCSVTIAAVNAGVIGQTIRLEIRTIEPVPQRRNFAICVPPLFGSVSVARLVEFLEVSRILGAEHMTVYDFQLSAEVSAVLDYYSQEQRFVSVVPWKLDRSIDEGIWYHGQLVSIQDCLYRMMASANYVAFNDIDEFIVPQNSRNWSHMMQLLDNPKRCAFQFKSAFFRPTAQEDSELMTSNEFDLQTLVHFERTSNFDRVRTKCMVKAFSIFEKGIHHVSKPIWADLEVHPVETGVAFLHHYRVCLHGMGMNCGSYEQDRSILRYKNEIISAVNASNYSLQRGLIS